MGRCGQSRDGATVVVASPAARCDSDEKCGRQWCAGRGRHDGAALQRRRALLALAPYGALPIALCVFDDGGAGRGKRARPHGYVLVLYTRTALEDGWRRPQSCRHAGQRIPGAMLQQLREANAPWMLLIHVLESIALSWKCGRRGCVRGMAATQCALVHDAALTRSTRCMLAVDNYHHSSSSRTAPS